MVISKLDKDNNRVLVNDITSYDKPFTLFHIDYITREQRDSGEVGLCFDDAKIIAQYLAKCYNMFIGEEDPTQIY